MSIHHTTYDVHRQTTVVATHTRKAPAVAAPRPKVPAAKPAPEPTKPDWTTGFSFPGIKIDIIGDGDRVLVDGLMSRAHALMLCKFMAALSEA